MQNLITSIEKIAEAISQVKLFPRGSLDQDDSNTFNLI
jgi:hypothetical protein